MNHLQVIVQSNQRAISDMSQTEIKLKEEGETCNDTLPT